MVLYFIMFGTLGTVSAIYIIRKIRELQWGWVKSTSSLKDKLFIITGANTGLGYETSKHLVKRGAKVILACRDSTNAEQAISKIRQYTGNGEMSFIKLDLSSFESIKTFANTIKSDYPNFDCLINNAGLAKKEHSLTADGFEMHFGVNYLGHFLLYNLLEDNVRRNKSRVVVVTSSLHERGKIDFNEFTNTNTNPESNSRHNKYYANSKLANFYFARELYKRGVDCHTLCPGLCYTSLFRDYKPKWYHFVAFSPVIWLMLRTAEQGAQSIIHCATDNINTEELNPYTGYYIKNLKQTKSKHVFEDVISTRLYEESLRLCSK
ncbi:retinol dehydrogenase 12-like [Condylostylus longicornis]|uniref:retinol dehydrogenase 12-like n=1 Tax=Condylostylus longicornis TaxID=2530218 RepID=UPI00244DDE65|nr:retinol dehydrogenase 12-like [Condylostylus longicornis]